MEALGASGVPRKPTQLCMRMLMQNFIEEHNTVPERVKLMKQFCIQWKWITNEVQLAKIRGKGFNNEIYREWAETKIEPALSGATDLIVRPDEFFAYLDTDVQKWYDFYKCLFEWHLNTKVANGQDFFPEFCSGLKREFLRWVSIALSAEDKLLDVVPNPVPNAVELAPVEQLPAETIELQPIVLPPPATTPPVETVVNPPESAKNVSVSSSGVATLDPPSALKRSMDKPYFNPPTEEELRAKAAKIAYENSDEAKAIAAKAAHDKRIYDAKEAAATREWQQDFADEDSVSSKPGVHRRTPGAYDRAAKKARPNN